MEATILVIDDEKDIRSLLSRTLTYENYEVLTASDAKGGLKLLRDHQNVNVVICDVKLPDARGIHLTKDIKEQYPETEIICLTAFGNIQDGVQAMKNGAFDYLVKGDDNGKIIPLTGKAVEKSKLQFRIKELEKRISSLYSFKEIIGKAPVLREAVEQAQKVAPSNATVLLTGPTGTGKEVFAQSIHNGSKRSASPFVAVNCSAFGKDLLESELFGYKAGAFTGANKDKKGLMEEAHKGTLFLDEIGELNLDLQAKLLRVLESGTFIKVGETKESKVDVRVIAATNRNLEKEIKEGRFREDLYYRLSVFQIKLPSLNERKEDIPLLVNHFIKHFELKVGKKITKVSEAYIQALQDHSWRGNIRELRNIVERSVILSEDQNITKEMLPLNFDELIINEEDPWSLKAVEKRHIQKVLQYAQGNKTRTATLLGIGLTTLYRKLEEFDIT